jgi:N-acetyl-anhydromuramyl-L-alanine amidase AmpD
MYSWRSLLFLLFTVSFLPGLLGATPPKKPKVKPEVQFTTELRKKMKSIRVEKGRWKMIILHHSGLANGNAASYDRAHRERGMENGLAYHFLIGNGVDSADGKIEIGSRWIKQIKGGHVRSDAVNEVAIGICLVGNFEVTKPTRKQLLALSELIEYLKTEVVGGKVKLLSHGESHPGHTKCPGKHFPMKRLHRLHGK